MEEYKLNPDETINGKIQYEPKTNSFWITDAQFRIYPDDLAQMIEIIARHKKIDLLLIVKNNFNDGVLQLSPKVKWIGEK